MKTKVACSMHAGIFHQTATQFRCLWWGGGSWRGAYAEAPVLSQRSVFFRVS